MEQKNLKVLVSVFIVVAMMTSLAPSALFSFPVQHAQATSVKYRRGVNIAGAEFNSGTLPGTVNKNYTFNNEATFKYFGEKGFDIIRVPVLWERLQPTLGGSLNTDYLNGLKSNINWAKKYGMQVIIDVHNYGRYRGNIIGTSAVTSDQFNNLWIRLSTEFKNESGVYGYDLMNEPHDMGTSDWKAITQSAVMAIRNNGDNKLIIVEGNGWANAHDWEKKNGTATSWITDPANNFMYSAHCYFDSDASGTYKKTYDEELRANPNLVNIGVDRVMDFINWCNKNKVRGLLGEFGVPANDARWNVVLENFMKVLDTYGFDATYWAAGVWWGTYQLSVQPINYTTDTPQMSVLLQHLSGNVSVPKEISYYPIADAYTRDGSYSNNNYGTAAILDIKKEAAGYNRKAYLKFDLSDTNQTVKSAKLKLYGSNNADNTAMSIDVYQVTNDNWNESTISWNNAPAMPIKIGSFPVTGTMQYYEMDLTDYVVGQMAVDKVISIGLDTATQNKLAEFRSKESTSNKPILLVEFEGPKVIQSFPADGKKLYIHAPAYIDFDMDMDASTVTDESNITISPTVNYSLSYDSDKRRCNITFPEGLAQTQYTITVKAESVKSVDQEPMNEDKVITFTGTSSAYTVEPIQFTTDISSINAHTMVINHNASPLDTAFILVLYQNNTVKNIAIQQAAIEPGEEANIQTATLNAQGGLSNYQYKAFLWNADTLNNLTLTAGS